jgi:O-antigen/teichoic acid export membrane protein
MLSKIDANIRTAATAATDAVGNIGAVRAAGRLWFRACDRFIVLPSTEEVADFLREYAEEDELAAVEREAAASVAAAAGPAAITGAHVVTVVEPARTTADAAPPNAALRALAFAVMGRRMTRAFVPAALSQALVVATSSVAVMVVGTQLGVEALAHFSLGITMWNMVGVSVVTGFGCALDTLCPQAFGRDPESPEIAEHFVVGTILCVLCNVPMYFVFNYMMHDVSVLLFGAALGASVETFLQNSSLALLFATLSMTLSKMLNAQFKAEIPMLGTAASVVTCAAANVYLVPRYGIEGAMVALALTNFVCFAATLGLALRDRRRSCCCRRSARSAGRFTPPRAFGSLPAWALCRWWRPAASTGCSSS